MCSERAIALVDMLRYIYIYMYIYIYVYMYIYIYMYMNIYIYTYYTLRERIHVLGFTSTFSSSSHASVRTRTKHESGTLASVEVVVRPFQYGFGLERGGSWHVLQKTHKYSCKAEAHTSSNI